MAVTPQKLNRDPGISGERPGNPAELLQRAIVNNVPEVSPDLHAKVPWLPEKITEPIAEKLGEWYHYACIMASDNLSFWVGVFLLALTLISWVTHRSLRGRRRGAPVTL
jgi:hypothetical protein